jgi:hypothetical protein
MNRGRYLALMLAAAWSLAAAAADAITIYPFTAMGPEEDLANGLDSHWRYPFGSYLVLTTDEGFHIYDHEAEQWLDRTWPGWIGKSIYAVVPAGGAAGRLAMGGVNAFFKGTLLLSEDLGATDDLVHQCQGGRVTDLAISPFEDSAIFACTWSDVVDGEVLRSDDGGLSYQALTGHGHHVLTGIEAISNSEIYVAGDNHVSRSLDGGQTWENLQANLPGGQVIHCLLTPQPITGIPDGSPPGPKDGPYIEAGFLLAGNDTGVFMSGAQEIDWQLILPEACRAVAHRFVQLDTFVYWSEWYAVTFDGRLLVCLNGDWDGWVDATDMIAPAVPIDVAVMHGPVYVATREHGVYRSAGIDGVSPAPPSPGGLQLAARPNPFNPACELVFQVPDAGHATVTVYDLTGRKVADVFAGELSAGTHRAPWHPRRLASGVYHAVLRQAGRQISCRVSLVK